MWAELEMLGISVQLTLKLLNNWIDPSFSQRTIGYICTFFSLGVRLWERGIINTIRSFSWISDARDGSTAWDSASLHNDEKLEFLNATCPSALATVSELCASRTTAYGHAYALVPESLEQWDLCNPYSNPYWRQSAAWFLKIVRTSNFQSVLPKLTIFSKDEIDSSLRRTVVA